MLELRVFKYDIYGIHVGRGYRQYDDAFINCYRNRTGGTAVLPVLAAVYTSSEVNLQHDRLARKKRSIHPCPLRDVNAPSYLSS